MKKKIINISIICCILAIVSSVGYVAYKKAAEPILEEKKVYSDIRDIYHNTVCTDNQSSSSCKNSSDSNNNYSDADTETHTSDSGTSGATSGNNVSTTYNTPLQAIQIEYTSNIIGWISVPNTEIDYPVCYIKDDNKFYLTHNFMNQYDSYGAIFLDGNSYPDAKNMTVFGHNMDVYWNSMFHDLLKFEDSWFFYNNGNIQFDIGSGSTEWEPIGLCIVNLDKNQISYNNSNFSNDKEFTDFANKLLDSCKLRKDVEITADDQLLTLSTCSYHYKNCRTVVVLRRK